MSEVPKITQGTLLMQRAALLAELLYGMPYTMIVLGTIPLHGEQYYDVLISHPGCESLQGVVQRWRAKAILEIMDRFEVINGEE